MGKNRSEGGRCTQGRGRGLYLVSNKKSPVRKRPRGVEFIFEGSPQTSWAYLERKRKTIRVDLNDIGIIPVITDAKSRFAEKKSGRSRRANKSKLSKTCDYFVLSGLFRLGAILQEVVRQKNSFGVCVCVWQGGGGGGAFCKGAITQRIERYNSVIAMRLFTTPIKPPPETTYFFHSAGGFTLTSPTPGLCQAFTSSLLCELFVLFQQAYINIAYLPGGYLSNTLPLRGGLTEGMLLLYTKKALFHNAL